MRKGIFQIIVGTFVMITSYIVNKRAGDSKFTLFLIVGGVFLVYGLLKFLYYIIIKPKRIKRKKEEITHKFHHDSKKERINTNQIQEFKKNESPFHSHHETIVACHSCSTKHYGNANYCQMCGSKFK